MMKRKLVSVLSFFLSVLMLIGALPLGVFAVGTPSGNATPNYTEFRGKFGMSADANGVMIYDDLEDYYKTSKKDVKLSTDYGVEVYNEATGANSSVGASYAECPYLYADYAIYFDETIEKTTAKIRYGLSMMDSVYYMDSSTGEIVKGDKSPIELTANYNNAANPDYNAGLGMVYDENGKLEYTTRQYEKKSIIFYIINHRSSERIGQEDDVSILSDYIEQGYVIVTVDFKSNEYAVTPYVENALVPLRAMFNDYATDAALKELGLVTDKNNLFFLPEGCRIERDVWYWDPSIWGVNGSMEKFREVWNTLISYEAEVNQALDDPKKYDTLGFGEMDSVEDMVSIITKKDGTPVEYKQTMDIIYPSQPKEGYEVPVYIQEATGQSREMSILTGYTRCTWTGFALNGYACIEYDHPFWPFVYRQDYTFSTLASYYGLTASDAINARAAVRCAKYLADDLGYSKTRIGAGGVSKATIGMAALAVKNNKQIPPVSITAFGKTFDNSYYEGDVLVDGAVSKAIVQPFMYYDEECTNEVSSDCAVVYNSSGDGVKTMFMGYSKYELVPTLLSSGVNDYCNSFKYWDTQVKWFEENASEPFLPITQLDQGHTFIVGYDKEYDYDRFDGMLKFFDAILKPETGRIPEVLWVTPIDGARDVPVTGKWQLGPYTLWDSEPNTYYHDQSIQIRFVYSVDPESVNEGVTITDKNGNKVEGTWIPSQHNALYTFECDGLAAGMGYTIRITSGVKNEDGQALVKEREVSFKTEGTYLVKPMVATYVSSEEPDKSFGTADSLKVSDNETTLTSYATETIKESLSAILRAKVELTSRFTGVNVYVLDDMLVDGTTLTYNTLTASDAWTNKTLLGSCEITDGVLSVDLSALAEMELGEYVTLAFVVSEPTDTYVYENDFETPTIGTAVEATLNGNTFTVVSDKGKVTCARANYTLSDGTVVVPWTSKIPVSPFIWCRAGLVANASIVKNANISGSQIFSTVTNGDQFQKFFNAVTDDAENGLTDGDVGKTFQISFDVYPTRDREITVGMAGVSGAAFTGETHVCNAPANTWTTVNCEITITADMVSAQAGMLAIRWDYPHENDGTTKFFTTYLDNIRVEETLPSLSVEADAFSLVTTKRGIALNEGITVTFDEAQDPSTLAKELVVRNESTGKYVNGKWVAVSDDNTSFTFVTKGLAADTTYTVSLDGEVIRTAKTEGSYALRPVATSYVSKSEPKKHFGLDVEPILDGDKLGVFIFSAKTLKNMSLSKLYLDVETEKNSAVSVYALAGITPDSTLCYNSIADELATALRLGSDNVTANVDNKLAIDLSALADKDFGDYVALVIKPGYVFSNDFETPKVTANTVVLEGGNTAMPDLKEFYSDEYFWSRLGVMANGTLMKATATASQNFMVYTNRDQHIKFYNTLKTSAFDEFDLGREFNVSFMLRTDRRNVNGVVDDTEITLDLGYTTRQNNVTYDGTNYLNSTFVDTPDARPTVTLSLIDQSWRKVSFDVTVNEAMVALQAGCLTVHVPTLTPDNGASYLTHYFDDMLVEEAVNYTLTLPTDGVMLMTDNTAAAAITEEDNPVVDEELLLPDVVIALNESIPVTFDEAVDPATLANGMVVTNETTGKRVKGEWIAVSDDNMSFAFVTKGFVADTFYTVNTTSLVKTSAGVALEDKLILTVGTEGNYALRPVATSYVSKSEPTKHFGLDAEPMLDGDKLGVVIFSAKTLKGMDLSKLYLDVETEKNTAVSVYALAGITPNSTLCYNTVAEQLSTASIVGSSDAVDGSKLAIDLSALADKDFGEYVTLVIKAGYRFFNDFETPQVTANTVIPEGGSTAMPDLKQFYSDEYIWSRLGVMANGTLMKATATESQKFMVYTNREQWIKFYNTLKTSAFDEHDLGREFDVSFKLHTDRRTVNGVVVDDEEITLDLGYTTRQNNVTYDGTNYLNSTFVDTPDARPTVTLSLIDGKWREVSFDVTVNEAMVALQAGCLTLHVPTLTPDGGVSWLTHYYDDMLVEEVVNYTVTLPVDSLILMTENTASVAVTEDDNPVVDEELVLPAIDSAQIGVGKDITVYYFATAESEAPEMRFTVGDKSETVSGTKSGDKFVFVYCGIAPQGMGENIKAELIENGEVVATYDGYSVEEYCKNLLAMTASELGLSETKCAAMKTAVADMLAYGAAAQKYTGTNVNDLVSEGVEGASEFTALDSSFQRLPGASTSSDIRFTAAGVYFDYTNHLYFKFNAAGITEDNFILRVSNGQTGIDYTLSDFDVLGENSYRLMTDGIAALDFGTMYTVELIRVDGGESVVQTLEYGINSYVYSMQNDPDMAELAQRTYLYGVSSAAYVNAE